MFGLLAYCFSGRRRRPLQLNVISDHENVFSPWHNVILIFSKAFWSYVNADINNIICSTSLVSCRTLNLDFSYIDHSWPVPRTFVDSKRSPGPRYSCFMFKGISNKSKALFVSAV